MANVEKKFQLGGIGGNVQYGKGGGRLKWATDHFEIRNASDSALVQIHVPETPTNDSSAASKKYVDSVAAGLDPKASVRAATTGEIAGLTYDNGTDGVGATLTGSLPSTVDGVTLVDGDRVLVKNQSDKAHNGIYVVGASAWTRSSDFDGSPAQEVDGGEYVFIEEGVLNADTGWVNSSNYATTATLGTDAIEFVQFSSAGIAEAGNGLDKTGNLFSVVGTADRITVSGAGVDIASTYVGQTSITTVGTITAGTWNGTIIGTEHGGTGLSTIGTGKQVLRTNAAGDALEYADLVAGDVAVTLSPVNYTAGSATVEAHLTGIDAALAGAGGDIGDLQTELNTVETSVGLNTDGTLTWTGGLNYVGPSDTVKDAVEGLDAQVKVNTDGLAALLAEVNTAEGSLGLNTDGTLSWSAGLNYVGASDTVKDAVENLDAQVKVNTDGLAALLAEVNTAEASLGLNTDGTLTWGAGLTYVGASDTVKDAVEGLDAGLESIQAELDATQAGAGLGVGGAYTANGSANYIAAATSLKDADDKLDAAIKTVETTLANLSQSRIEDTTGGNTFVDVEMSGAAEKIVFGIEGTELAVMEKGATAAGGEQFTFTNADGEVQIKATNDAGTGDVDIRLIPQGNGQVFIGDMGDGVIQADDDSNLTLAGGDGTTGGNLLLRGGNGSTSDGLVKILDADANEVMVFQGVASAVNHFVATNAATGGVVSLAADGDDADIDILLDPKGSGLVLAPSGYDMSAGPASAFATKGYIDSVKGDADSALTTAIGDLRTNMLSADNGTAAGGTTILVGTTVASAVNYGTVKNSAEGAAVEFGVDGADADINLVLAPKGGGALLAPTGYELAPESPAEALTTKEYVDAAVAAAQSGATIGGIRMISVPFTAAEVGVAAKTIGVVKGRVLRVRVEITTPFDNELTVGRTDAVAELAPANLIDETEAGVSEVTVNQNYGSDTTLVIDGNGATAGAGFVMVEYAAA